MASHIDNMVTKHALGRVFDTTNRPKIVIYETYLVREQYKTVVKEPFTPRGKSLKKNCVRDFF